MFWRILLFLLIGFEWIKSNQVLGANRALFPMNEKPIDENLTAGSRTAEFDSGEILRRDKRYLLFSGGGISKVSFHKVFVKH